MKSLILVLAGALLLFPQARANAQAIAEAFISSEGYEAVDTLLLEDEVDALLPPTESVFRSASELSSLVKAGLLVEAREVPLQRGRYLLTVSLVPGSETQLVQIDRFNLGPLIREELVQSHGPDNVAPAVAFGTGPHVSWRFVTTPLQGNRAIIVEAARRELDNAEASSMHCLLTACLATYTELAESTPLHALEPIEAELAGSYPTRQEGLLTPAAMFELLAEHSGLVLEGNERAAEGSGESFVAAQAILDRNLGQEFGLDGIMRVGELMDDSVSATWFRLVEMPGPEGVSQLFGARDVECRRGEAVGLLCP